MDIRKVFGQNLRHYRLAAKISQEALAGQMGVDRAHISSMERGKQNVTLITLWLAAVALQVKPEVLLIEPEIEPATIPLKAPRKPRGRPLK